MNHSEFEWVISNKNVNAIFNVILVSQFPFLNMFDPMCPLCLFSFYYIMFIKPLSRKQILYYGVDVIALRSTLFLLALIFWFAFVWWRSLITVQWMEINYFNHKLTGSNNMRLKLKPLTHTRNTWFTFIYKVHLHRYRPESNSHLMACIALVLFLSFFGILTFVGYLMSKQSLRRTVVKLFNP